MKKLAFVLLLASVTSLQAQFISNTGIELSNSTVLSTNGDWANQGTIKNNGSIITTESWTNSGTLDAASTGGFFLKYSANKSFTPGGSSFGFIIKEGNGHVDFTGSFSLKDSLGIKGGTIKLTSATDVITLSETALVTSFPGSFVEGGTMVRKGTGSLLFPVGKNGVSLPITFVNVDGTNASISIAVEDAPVGYIAGAGINSLINFPYVWKATKTNVTDSAYVEVEYPDALPNATDAIIVRKVAGQNKYEGMGARSSTSSAGKVKIRSYSRGAQGVFSVASGFKGNLETDSLALVSLFDKTGGTSWTNKNNWKSGAVNTWQGITETGGQITAVNLPNNKLTGPVPPQFADLAALQTVNLSGNEITSLPNLSGSTGITTLNISNNRLDFGSLIPNAAIAGVNYANQADLTTPATELLEVGTTATVSITTGGTGNVYQWKRNDAIVNGANSDTYTIGPINRTNMGTYIVEVTNPAVPNLTLKSGNKKVLATAKISGTVFETDNSPLTTGKITLFRVTPVGAYEKVLEDIAINSNGTYLLDKVVLDDYVLLAEADATTFPTDLPTYFKNKIYWEEADKIILNENVDNANISMQKKPTTKPQGQGIIAGFFEEPVPTGGRTLENRRISNAGASVRRKTNVGKPQDEVLVLVAYLFTNENGEFGFENLETGDYVLNLQYPGFPMDPTSFINISVGTGLARSVEVGALVQDNKIVVSKRVVTGWDESDTQFSVFPNPTSAALNIRTLKPFTGLRYEITNSVGQQVGSGDIANAAEHSIDVQHLTPGIYQVTLMQANTQIKNFRIVIQ